MSKVVNVKVKHIRLEGYDNLKEWCLDKNNVYIGRKNIVFIDNERYPKNDSKWSNPFKITPECTREQSIKKYRKMILKSALKDDLKQLKNKNLGCWCKPEKCHGDVLIELLKRIENCAN